MSRKNFCECLPPTLVVPVVPVCYAPQVGSVSVAGDPQVLTSPAAMVGVWPLALKVVFGGKTWRGRL